MQAGGDSVQRAVALAVAARDGAAAAVVLRHLESTEGTADRLVDLHLALGQPQQACAVAVARARHEQASGNYKVGRRGCYLACACGGWEE